jgi:hypothetical protein
MSPGVGGQAGQQNETLSLTIIIIITEWSMLSGRLFLMFKALASISTLKERKRSSPPYSYLNGCPGGFPSLLQ